MTVFLQHLDCMDNCGGSEAAGDADMHSADKLLGSNQLEGWMRKCEMNSHGDLARAAL
jgi:hypothetical protein